MDSYFPWKKQRKSISNCLYGMTASYNYYYSTTSNLKFSIGCREMSKFHRKQDLYLLFLLLDGVTVNNLKQKYLIVKALVKCEGLFLIKFLLLLTFDFHELLLKYKPCVFSFVAFL